MFTVWWIALCNVHSCVNSKAGSLSNDDEILISRNSRSVRQVALKVCQGSKNAMTALNSKCKYEKVAVVVRFPQTTQYFVFLRTCFTEEGKEVYKALSRLSGLLI